jgi:hypothetical protein
MKLGMYIIVLEPISTEYFINPSHQSVYISLSLYIIDRQRISGHVPVLMNTRNNRIIVGDVFFSTVSVISKESLCVPIWFLVNGSVNMFPRQQKNC